MNSSVLIARTCKMINSNVHLTMVYLQKSKTRRRFVKPSFVRAQQEKCVCVRSN